MRHSPPAARRASRQGTAAAHRIPPGPYVDRPPHDAPDQAREDEAKARALIEASYIAIRFHHGADWQAVFRRHPDLFGA